MSILCSLKNLFLSFGPKEIFEDASFIIHKNDRIGLLGPNGHGKSSLFKILCDKLSPDQSTPPFEFIKSKDELKNDIQIFLVPQSPSISPNEPSTISDFFFSFYPHLQELFTKLDELNNQISTSSDPQLTDKLLKKQKDLFEQIEISKGWEIQQSFTSYLKFFNIPSAGDQFNNLSGGEQRKVLLSLGLSAPHDLILWDEPTNHLDLETINQFETELIKSNKTMVIISHDRHLLSKICNQIFFINNKKVNTFKGNYCNYLEEMEKQEEANKVLLKKLSNSLRREQDWMNQGIKARGTRSKKRVENFHELKSSVNNLKLGAKKEMEFSIGQSHKKSKLLIEVTDVSYDVANKDLFNDVSLNVCKNDKIGLIGSNGTGKTSLVKIISELLPPKKGQVRFPSPLSIQLFNQLRTDLESSITAYEFLGEGNDFVPITPERKLHVKRYFEQFNFFSNDLHRPVHTFSGGEKNRLQLAFNLLQHADLWIFDEPTNDLDIETINILERKLKEFQGPYIIISHDRTFLTNVTNKIWFLHDQIVEEFNGGYEQVENYIHATHLEQSVKNHTEDHESPPPQKEDSPSPKKSKRISYKNKLKIEKISQEVQEIEQEIDTLEKKISDFSVSDHKEFEKMCQKKEELEETLLSHYEEIENLKET